VDVSPRILDITLQRLSIAQYDAKLFFVVLKHVAWDSVVGVATHYRLDGLGNESSLGQDFLHTSIQALGLTQPPIQWVMCPSWR
jgi:hypothetical protein